MKKSNIAAIIISVLMIAGDLYAQSYTPPVVSLGLTLNGNYATAEAFGDATAISQTNSYGMKWGRGVTGKLSYGLGEKRNSRLTFLVDYTHMMNGNNSQPPFFLFDPDTPKTVYDIISTGIGYEYLFNAHCPHKNYFGLALTGSIISAGEGSAIDFESATRMGLMFSTGYEFVMDQKYKTGWVIGFRYHIVNLFGKSNGTNNLNDGDNSPGPGFDRTIGILGLNFGMNFYLGTKRRTK